MNPGMLDDLADLHIRELRRQATLRRNSRRQAARQAAMRHRERRPARDVSATETSIY